MKYNYSKTSFTKFYVSFQPFLKNIQWIMLDFALSDNILLFCVYWYYCILRGPSTGLSFAIWMIPTHSLSSDYIFYSSLM